MNKIIERIKSIPVPIWIGLAIILILLFVFGSRKQQTAGPVTSATVGTQGAQPGAGTDQQLGNLSQIYQTGFNNIRMHEEENSQLLRQIAARAPAGSSVFTGMGSGIQQTQIDHAQANAMLGSGGQAHTGTSLYNVPIVDQYGGKGSIQVVAHDVQSAVENAHQGGNTPTGPAVPV